MSDHNRSHNAKDSPVEIDPGQERDVAEWFRRTSPDVPPFDSEKLTLHSQPSSTIPRTSMAVRVTVSLAAAALLITSFLIWQPTPVDAYVTFAEMQDNLEQVKTISYRQRTLLEQSSDKPKETPVIEKVLLLAPSTIRVEQANGSYSLLDLKRGRSMAVDPKKKRVMRFEGMANITPEMKQMNFYDFIRNIQAKAVSELPAKTIDGKKRLGFRIERAVDHPMMEKKLSLKMNVWVDPQTKLPVRIEELAPESTASTKYRVAVVMDRFQFDQPLKKELFTFDPPEGYIVQSFGAEKLLPPKKDKSLQQPMLKPKVGIGPVKFGMLQDEVVKLFGKPEKVIPLGKNGASLEYYSRGVGMNVSDVLGVTTISAKSQTFTAIQVRTYAGKTDKGIVIGSTEQTIRDAYGKPSNIEDRTKEGGPRTLYYDQLDGWFSLWQGKVESMFFYIPRETKAKLMKQRKNNNPSE